MTGNAKSDEVNKLLQAARENAKKAAGSRSKDDIKAAKESAKKAADAVVANYKEGIKNAQFSTNTKIACGAVGLAGIGLIVAAGGKRQARAEAQQAKAEGKTFAFKPLKRAFMRLAGLAMAALSIDAIAHGDKSIVGKHTARLFQERNQTGANISIPGANR
jgi:hypothetical protein